jgi:hypothetical protein
LKRRPGGGTNRTVGKNLVMTADPRQLHHAFTEAEFHADTSALRALLADDFRSIGDQGFVLNKAQWLGKFGDFSYATLESENIEVSSYDCAAIVRYVQRSRSIWQGREMTSTTRVSQTWIEQADGWRLAGIQFSPLPDA